MLVFIRIKFIIYIFFTCKIIKFLFFDALNSTNYNVLTIYDFKNIYLCIHILIHTIIQLYFQRKKMYIKKDNIYVYL